MNKNLRLFMTALLCAVFGLTWGQTPEVTLDFTTNEWQLPEGSGNKGTEAKDFSNGTYTITLEASTGYYFNAQGYLMLGKSGSTLTLPAFDFAVSAIEVVGNSAASAAVVQNIFVGEDSVSTSTVGAKGTNIYEIAANSQAAGTIYTLKVLSEHNTQITKINIYKAGSGTVKPVPTMSFSATSFTVTVGEDFQAPELTYDGDGIVTYASDNEEVATVDASTGEVDVVAAGVANITASASETANYKSASASYKITAKEPQEVQDGVFDFTGTTNYGTNLTPSAANEYIYDPVTWTAGNVTLVTEGKYRWWYAAAGNTLRLYSNKVDEEETTKITISVPAGKTISQIDFSGSGIVFAPSVGEFDSNKWTGEAQSVVLTYAATGTSQIKTIKVTYDNGETPVVKEKPTMKFSTSYVTVVLDDPFTAPELTYNGDGIVTYASDNEEVATVNATTGAVTIKAAGQAKITASATETDNYEAAEASYTISVTERQGTHEVVDGTFDFTDATDYGSGLTPSGENEYIYDPVTWTAGNVTLVTEGKYRWWLNANGNTLRLYTNVVDDAQTSKLTISVPAGKKINKIEFTGNDNIVFTPSTGNFADKAWTGSAQTVVLTYAANGTMQISTITVDYGGDRINPQLAWSAERATATLGQAFTAPTLSWAQGFNGEITYSSSNENVATISATGAVTIVGAGTTVIKATTPSTDIYTESTATYTLTVTDPDATDVTYDFTTTNDYDTGLQPSAENEYIYDDYTWTNGEVSLVTSGKYRYWYNANGNTLRLYSNIVEEEETTKLTFSVPASKAITSIEFEGQNIAFTANVGTFEGTSWAGESQSVVLTLADNKKPYIRTIKVSYKATSDNIVGDANGDGQVTVQDVQVAVAYVLSGDESFINLDNADVNGDGSVNITDIQLIVNMILN